MALNRGSQTETHSKRTTPGATPSRQPNLFDKYSSELADEIIPSATSLKDLTTDGSVIFTKLNNRKVISLSVVRDQVTKSYSHLVDFEVEFSDYLENASAVRQHLGYILDQDITTNEKSLREQLDLAQFCVDNCSIIKCEKFLSSVNKDGTIGSEKIFLCLHGDSLITFHGPEVDLTARNLCELACRLQSNRDDLNNFKSLEYMLHNICSLISSNGIVLDEIDLKRQNIRRVVKSSQSMNDSQVREIAEISYMTSEMGGEFKRLSSSLSLLRTNSPLNSRLLRDDSILQIVSDIESGIDGLASRCNEIVSLSNTLLATNERTRINRMAAETHQLAVEAHEINKRTSFVTDIVGALAPAWTGLYLGEYLSIRFPTLANGIVETGLAISAAFIVIRLWKTRIFDWMTRN